MSDQEVPTEIVLFVQQRTFLIVFTVLDSFLGIGSGLLNGISAMFYKHKLSENINHLLYFALSVIGVVISFGALLHIFILIFTISYDQNTLNILLPISYLIMVTSTFTSAFLNVSLVAVRTIHIIYPLKFVNRRAVLVSIGIYWFLALTVATVDVYFWTTGELGPGYEYYYSFINMSGVYGILSLLHSKELLHQFVVENHKILFPMIMWFIPFVIPSIICLLCSVIQISSIWRKKRLRQEDKTHTKVTITILLLTVTFFICNTISFTYCILMVSGDWKGYEVYLCLYVFTSMVPFINTFVNPIILITRGHQLRRFFLQFVRLNGRASREEWLQMDDVVGKDTLKIEHPVTRQETIESFTKFK